MANRIVVNTDVVKSTIDRNIYGHFSEHLGRCIYEGLWVGEDSPIPNTMGLRNDVLEALRKIKIPVLRWPGGCFADEYHWKDGIGPRNSRKRMVNTHWGGVVENNHFGTHEFLLLCELLECEPYITGNVGSGTVQEMQEWVEYMTFDGESPPAALRELNGRKEPWKLRYFGVGNENWGCGGNMRPEYYADVYRRYQTYVRNYGSNSVFKIACGANTDDYAWTEVLMREAAKYMDGLSFHYYTLQGAWNEKGLAAEFDEADWFTMIKNALRMDELLTRHGTIMDRYDPAGRIALIVDEWGTWHKVEPGTNPGFLYQQNTIRDAIVAGATLNIFNNHADRVRMANIAQTVNVLQAVVLTEGARLVLTPTWHVFDMYSVHHDAALLGTHTESDPYIFADKSLPRLSASASRAADGAVNLTVCTVSHNAGASVDVILHGLPAGKRTIEAVILTAEAMNAHNTFDNPEAVRSKPFHEYVLNDGGLTLELPAMSIVRITVR